VLHIHECEVSAEATQLVKHSCGTHLCKKAGALWMTSTADERRRGRAYICQRTKRELLWLLDLRDEAAACVCHLTPSSHIHVDLLPSTHMMPCNMACPLGLAAQHTKPQEDHLHILYAPWLATIKLRNALHLCKRDKLAILPQAVRASVHRIRKDLLF
jgi:hypothetical protein